MVTCKSKIVFDEKIHSQRGKKYANLNYMGLKKKEKKKD